MAAHAALTDGEKFLYCMLQDPAGIDAAEFTWIDHEQEDNCWRAWPFQWSWWRCPDQRQIDQAARSIGKSTGIAARAFSWPFRRPGQQMAIIAPQLNHLRPLNTLIEQRLTGTRLTREIMKPGSKAVTHPGQALQAEFLNGATLFTRIPQADGKAAKGIHPVVLECDECLPAGTLILAKRGLVAIENVVVGDMVLTHRRRWRRVTGLASRRRETVLLKGHGTPGLVASINHPFRACRRAQANIIGTDGKLKRTTVIGDPQWTPAADLGGCNWSTPTRYPQVKHVPSFRKPGTSGKVPCGQDSDDFFWMMGLYIAEGSYNASSGGCQVTFSLHQKEIPYVRKRLEALGLLVWDSPDEDDLGSRLLTNSRVLGEWLETHCGKGAHNKQVPVWALGLQTSRREALLDGLVYGDGYEQDATDHATAKFKLTTVSRRLSVSARLLAMTLDWWANIHWCDTSQRETFIRGRRVTSDGFYQVVGTRDGKGFEFGWERFSQVREVIRTDTTELLYDLTVAEDSSFLADGFIVHNSQDLTEATWDELIETVKRDAQGSKWLVHGVTRGVQDKFYKFSQPGSGWTVHRLTSMSRPGWSAEERANKIEEYGGYDTPNYKRNVLGEHGDQSSPLFTAKSLFACVDDDELSDYNTNEYRRIDIYGENLSAPGDILYSLDHPMTHVSGKYERFWVGEDLGHCVDEETEILTKRGWLRYDQVSVGDFSLAIDPDTGLSSWQEITALYREAGTWDMIEMEGQTFSSLTTPHHKWLVHYNEQHPERLRWKTTATLNTKDRIPLTARRGDAPRPTHSDDLVELAAWYMTEGCLLASGGIEISQSFVENAEKTDRIRSLLQRLYGSPGRTQQQYHHREPDAYRDALAMFADGATVYRVGLATGICHDVLRRWRDGKELGQEEHLWNETARFGCMSYFALPPRAAREVTAVIVGKEKVPTMAFLLALSVEQLNLFLAVAIEGDGHHEDVGGPSISQADKARIDAVQVAAALAGAPVGLRYRHRPTGRGRYPGGEICREGDEWSINFLVARSVGPVAASRCKGLLTDKAMTITPRRYEGMIWCPTLKHHNWLARRGGSVHFTGNTIAPSEIMVFGEHKPKGRDADSVLRLLLRVHLMRVAQPEQLEAILWVIKSYKPHGYGMDATGAGLPYVQMLQSMLERSQDPDLRKALDTIRGYDFGSKIVVGFDDTKDPDLGEDNEIKRNVGDFSFDTLRTLVDQRRIELPWDKELISEFQGIGYTVTGSSTAVDEYGKRTYSSSRADHALDGARMAALAFQQHTIEAILRPKRRESVYLGFVGG